MNALSQKPLLVKPNNHELAELYHTTFTSVEDILPYGHRLLEEGAQHVIISMVVMVHYFSQQKVFIVPTF